MRSATSLLVVLCPLLLLAACGEEETVLRVNRDAVADLVTPSDVGAGDVAAPVDVAPAVDSSGTLTFDQSGMRDCQNSLVSSLRDRQSS